MTFLFVILLRREEVQNPFLFGGLYLSQVGYGLFLFGWGICIPYYVGAMIFDVPLWNDWIFACTALCTFWGVLYTYQDMNTATDINWANWVCVSYN